MQLTISPFILFPLIPFSEILYISTNETVGFLFLTLNSKSSYLCSLPGSSYKLVITYKTFFTRLITSIWNSECLQPKHYQRTLTIFIFHFIETQLYITRVTTSGKSGSFLHLNYVYIMLIFPSQVSFMSVPFCVSAFTFASVLICGLAVF